MVNLELFNKFYEKNDIINADLILKNIFNKNITDIDVFNKYFEFKINVSSWDIDIPTRKIFLSEAEKALIYFSENVDLTEEIINKLEIYRSCLCSVKQQILDIERELYEKQLQERTEINLNELNSIVELRGKLKGKINKEEFDSILHELKSIESRFQVELLNEKQYKLYEELTKDITELVTSGIIEFERKELIKYNKKAIESYKLVYTNFTKDEKKYKDISQLQMLCSTSLFGYDTSKLFNETNIYYNQIYTYILSKLSDDLKYELTKLAVTKKI